MRIADAEKQRDARATYDARFKQTMHEHLGEKIGLTVQSEVEVSHLPLTIDVVVLLKDAAERANLLAVEPICQYFRSHNLIEFKSQADRLDEWDYSRIHARASIYLSDKRVPKDELTLTIVTASSPRGFLSGTSGEWELVKPGHYQWTERFAVHLLVCNELEIARENYLLLPFTVSFSGFDSFVEQVVSEEQRVYFNYALWIRPLRALEVLRMMGHQGFYDAELRELIEKFGSDILERIPPSELVKRLSVDERAKGLSADEHIKVLQSLSQAELRELIEKFGSDILERIPPSELVKRLSVDERVKGLSADEHIKVLQSLSQAELRELIEKFGSDILERIPPSELVKRLSVDERVKGLSADELVKRLSADERVKALQELSQSELRALPSEVRSELMRRLLEADNESDT